MRNQHRHSFKSLQAIIDSGKRITVCAEIYKLLKNSPPLTDKQVCKLLNRKMPSVQPRISDLLHDGVLYECGETKDPKSGLPVRLVRLRAVTDPSVTVERRAKARKMAQNVGKNLKTWLKLMGVKLDDPQKVSKALKKIGINANG